MAAMTDKNKRFYILFVLVHSL